MIDLTDRPVLKPLSSLLAAVRDAAGETPVLLIGAAARDLHLVHVHGIEVFRATEDTDLALAVRDWDMFARIRDVLIASSEFNAGGPQHRFWFRNQRVDIVPFAGVERDDRTIAWPPESAQVMNVAGLIEALATAVAVRLPGGLSFHVATLPALALLKVFAWHDRRYIAPGRDAADLWMFLRHYAEAGNEARLYGGEVEVLTTSGFDLEEAGALLLGRDARGVLERGVDQRRTLGSLVAILEPEIDPDGALRLVGQMPGSDRERQLQLLTAFHAGLTQEQNTGRG